MGGWVPDELTVQLTGTFAAMKETEKGFRPCVALKEGRCSIYALNLQHMGVNRPEFWVILMD